MGAPIRITGPLLDVLELLICASRSGEDIHGWTIVKSIVRPGPTVYGVLDRLEDAGWITGTWEAEHPLPGKPRRRFYSLTALGEREAAAVVQRRRDATLTRLSPGTAGSAL